MILLQSHNQNKTFVHIFRQKYMFDQTHFDVVVCELHHGGAAIFHRQNFQFGSAVIQFLDGLLCCLHQLLSLLPVLRPAQFSHCCLPCQVHFVLKNDSMMDHFCNKPMRMFWKNKFDRKRHLKLHFLLWTINDVVFNIHIRQLSVGEAVWIFYLSARLCAVTCVLSCLVWKGK